jgi:hypothetical protein
MRQVILSLGLDSLYSSTDACRDSLFRSEVFDFPPGAEITYYRGQFYNDTLCYQPGGVFFNPALSMKYRVELVHSTGAIDTIEEFEFAPFYNKFIYPKKVHIMNGSLISRDVYLRVKGTLAGLIDPDSLVDHADLSSTTAYPYDVDTTIIAYKSAGSPDIARLANGLNIQQPYPNPLQSNMSTFSFYVAYPKDGTIHLSLFNTIGQLLDKSIEINST